MVFGSVSRVGLGGQDPDRPGEDGQPAAATPPSHGPGGEQPAVTQKPGKDLEKTLGKPWKSPGKGPRSKGFMAKYMALWKKTHKNYMVGDHDSPLNGDVYYGIP